MAIDRNAGQPQAPGDVHAHRQECEHFAQTVVCATEWPSGSSVVARGLQEETLTEVAGIAALEYNFCLVFCAQELALRTEEHGSSSAAVISFLGRAGL